MTHDAATSSCTVSSQARVLVAARGATDSPRGHDTRLRRAVLRALNEGWALSETRLCQLVQAPRRALAATLTNLEAEGAVRRYGTGWLLVKAVGKNGGKPRRAATCPCGGAGRRTYGPEGIPAWTCSRCDRQWPRRICPDTRRL